jgi:carbonic anhydrase/acetyltransferase-like protein (isoleucine patch superfamily)
MGYLTLDLRSFPAVNRTVLEALIFMGARVLGLIPVRAFRVATLKVPKPTSWTAWSFFNPSLIESMTAWTLRSASARDASFPRAFWTALTKSALFIFGGWGVEGTAARPAAGLGSSGSLLPARCRSVNVNLADSALGAVAAVRRGRNVLRKAGSNGPLLPDMNLSERIRTFAAKSPTLAPDAYVAPGAFVVGDVHVGAQASVWFQAALRADLNVIRIGARSNIQDGAVVHVADAHGTHIGEDVTVGHGAILHACTVGDAVLVGMNAVVLDGAEIGARSIIGANALVTAGTRVPEGSLFLGSPGKVVRPLTEAEQADLPGWAERYVVLSEAYRMGVPQLLAPPLPPGAPSR